jgi:hypothetical protein
LNTSENGEEARKQKKDSPGISKSFPVPETQRLLTKRPSKALGRSGLLTQVEPMMIHWMTDDVRNDSRRSLSFGISETELANISNSYLLVSTDWSLIMLKETDGANWFQ